MDFPNRLQMIPDMPAQMMGRLGEYPMPELDPGPMQLAGVGFQTDAEIGRMKRAGYLREGEAPKPVVTGPPIGQSPDDVIRQKQKEDWEKAVQLKMLDMRSIYPKATPEFHRMKAEESLRKK